MSLATDDLEDIRIIRTRPRVGLHQLAQLIGANPAKRRQILLAEKYPSPLRVSDEPAKRLFCDALRLGWNDEELFDTAVERWWPLGPESDHAIVCRSQMIDATEEFGPLIDQIRNELADREVLVHLSSRAWSPLSIAGVRVADSPGLVLRRVRRGHERVGLLSFHISKTRPHTEGSARIAAALLESFARANQTAEATLEPELCVVVDVFAGLVTDAGGAAASTAADVERACEEIATCWSQL